MLPNAQIPFTRQGKRKAAMIQLVLMQEWASGAKDWELEAARHILICQQWARDRRQTWIRMDGTRPVGWWIPALRDWAASATDEQLTAVLDIVEAHQRDRSQRREAGP